MNRAKNILKNMRVNEISLVPEGDNPGADVLILKQRDAVGINTGVIKQRFTELANAAGHLFELAAGAEGAEGVETASTILKGLDMDIEQLNDRLEEIETSLEAVTKRAEDAEARATQLEADLAAVTKERDEAIAKGAAEGEGESEDDILKSLPEPIRKRLEDAERVARESAEAVEKAREDADRAERITKARELGVADAEGIGGLLYRIAKGRTTAEDEGKLVELLQIAKGVADEGKVLFEAIGKASGADAGVGAEAQAKLDAAIADIRKAKPEMTEAQAYSAALEANPGLYDEIRKHRP